MNCDFSMLLEMKWLLNCDDEINMHNGWNVRILRMMIYMHMAWCEKYEKNVWVEIELHDLRLKGVESLRCSHSCDNYIYAYTCEILDWKG